MRARVAGNAAERSARAVRERDSAGRRFNVKRTRCRQNVQSALMPLVPARQRVKSETRSYSAVPMRAKHSHTFPHCNTSFPRTLALLRMSAGRRAHQGAQNRKRVFMRSPQKLRMPLNTQSKAITRQFNRLNHTIAGISRHVYATRNGLEALMMNGVHVNFFLLQQRIQL